MFRTKSRESEQREVKMKILIELKCEFVNISHLSAPINEENNSVASEEVGELYEEKQFAQNTFYLRKFPKSLDLLACCFLQK